jgi:acyl-coenzyme A thioesterase 9
VDKTPITSLLWGMRKAELEKDSRIDSTKEFVNATILTKTVSESHLTLSYNFKLDTSLKDLYVDHKGHMLIGKLFEDMDALAGNVAFTHCDDKNPNTRRVSLVTASVDRIIKQGSISVNENLVISGQVAWVGRSSLDVVVEVHRADDISSDGTGLKLIEPTHTRLLSSYFTYVARDRETNKATGVNRLKVDTEAQQALLIAREQLAVTRKTRELPSAVDPQIVQLVATGRAAEDMPALTPPDTILMRSTSMESSLVCQPQSVNTSGRVFGGFISERVSPLC